MPASTEAVAVAVSAGHAADDKKAADLTLIDVADLLALADVFVVLSTTSDRQLKAVAEAIEARLKDEHDRRALRREGSADSGWLLLDFGDVVCHLFSEEQRSFYSLERLWADVPHLDPLTGEALAPGARDTRRAEDSIAR